MPLTTPRSPVPTLLLTLAAVTLLTLVALEWSPLLTMDRRVAGDLHTAATAETGWTQAARILTDWVWDPWTMRVILVASVWWLWRQRERLLAGWVLATGAVGLAVQQGLKAAVGRERPQWPNPLDSAHYASFPSGHTMSAAVTLGLMLWLLRHHEAQPRWRRAAQVLAVVSIAGVSLTRVWLGVHWLSDVVGGWLLGAALVAISAGLYREVALSRGVVGSRISA